MEMISSGRWDWWNEGKDPQKKPESWQPLTKEEQARVVVIPRQRRLQFDPDNPKNTWRRQSGQTNDNSASPDGASDTSAEQMELQHETTDAHPSPSKDVEVTVNIEITEVKEQIVSQRGNYEMGKAAYTQEQLIKSIIAMADYYGGLPTTAEMADYASIHRGTPSYQTILKQLGPKSTWQDKIDEYQAAQAQPEPNPGDSTNGVATDFSDLSEPLPAPEEAPSPETFPEGDPLEAEPAAMPEVPDRTVTEAVNEPIPPQITLSGAAKFMVKIDGQEYRFRLDFEDLAPIID